MYIHSPLFAISYYKKENGNWELKWTEKGYVGRNGITDNKKEGDGATPSGVYSFDLAFGLLDDPGSVLPYLKIVKGDFCFLSFILPHLLLPFSYIFLTLIKNKKQQKPMPPGHHHTKKAPVMHRYPFYICNLYYSILQIIHEL